jgi:hypothetical protein
MATDINPLDSTVTLLTTYWNSANTDSITPTIAKIYTKPLDKEPQPGEDIIYVYSQNTAYEPVGIGMTTYAKINESLKIDIRIKPTKATQADLINDTHARKVLVELRRILFTYLVNPNSSFQLIDPNMDIVDLSNGSRGVFRYVITLNLINYCNDMTA